MYGLILVGVKNPILGYFLIDDIIQKIILNFLLLPITNEPINHEQLGHNGNIGINKNSPNLNF
jgi:hypothetical protein